MCSKCGVWVRYVICMSMCRSTTYNNSKCCVYQYQYSVMLLHCSPRGHVHTCCRPYSILEHLPCSQYSWLDCMWSTTCIFNSNICYTSSLSRAIDPRFWSVALGSCKCASWPQPAKSRAQPCPQEQLPFHAYSTGELHCPVCRPVACFLRSRSVEGLSAVSRRHYSSSSDEVPVYAGDKEGRGV